MRQIKLVANYSKSFLLVKKDYAPNAPPPGYGYERSIFYLFKRVVNINFQSLLKQFSFNVCLLQVLFKNVYTVLLYLSIVYGNYYKECIEHCPSPHNQASIAWNKSAVIYCTDDIYSIWYYFSYIFRQVSLFPYSFLEFCLNELYIHININHINTYFSFMLLA